MDSLLNPSAIWSHVEIFCSGATALGLVGHAVNTFPTPKNKYGACFLGIVQFAVGQRVVAKNTLQGLQTDATSRPDSK